MSYRVTFNHAALINGKTQSRFGAFDAMLDPEVATPKTNAVLTVYVAVYLFDGYSDPQVTKNGMAEEAREEANKPAKKFKVYPWDPQKLNAWKLNYIKNVSDKWHRKFWLKTPSKYHGLNLPTGRPAFRSNVRCVLKLTEAKSKTEAHFAIAVVDLGPSKAEFRSHMFLYDSNDQVRTNAHEVGHLLGLDHPGGNSNKGVAYVDKPGKPGDLMGGGTNIYSHHAVPWQKAIGLITDTTGSDWKVHTNAIPPEAIAPKTK